MCNEIHDAKKLISALKDVSNWKELGSQLGMSGEQLDSIESDHEDVEMRKRAMLRTWFDHMAQQGKACWQRVVNALILMKQTNLAKKVAQQGGIFWVEESSKTNQTLRVG